MVATVGALRGLAALGLLSRVGYLSCVSGSSWAATPFLFAPDGDRRLGNVTPPESLSMAGLGEVDADSLLAPATARFRDAFATLDADPAVPASQVWIRAVGETYLAPTGLYDLSRPIGDGRSAAAGRPHGPRGLHPFPVVHATLNWPETRSAAQHKLPFEYTPLYAGSHRRRRLRDAAGDERIVGGALIETSAFGCAAPAGAPDAEGWVTVAPPARPWSLADMVGASSAFNTPDRDVRAYPHACYWTVPGEDGGPCPVDDLFTDGGDVDTLSLLGMLRRRVPRLVVFLNSVWPLSLDHDPRRWPEPGEIEPALPPLFGQPSARWPHNQVFSRDGYGELVAGWQAARRDGRPLVVSTRWPVLANEWWGIDGGWDASICWVYNSRVSDWESRLTPAVRSLLPADGAPGPASRFPHYLTVGQNAGALTRLTPVQANLLAELVGWGVLESADALRDALD